MTRTLFVLSVVGLLASLAGRRSGPVWISGRLRRLRLGGWGSTPQSSLARGLGYFNMGRGAYNEQTAVARSINTDTVMRWNQFAYQSHVTASNNYRARLLARRTSINRARPRHKSNCATIPRIAISPMAMRSTSCSATSRTQPNGSSSMRRITTPLRHELIPEIPFAYASEGITICLDQMTMNDQWPLALRVDDFKPEREGLRKAVQVALDEDKKGDLEPATVEAVQAAIDRFRLKFQKLVPHNQPRLHSRT